MDEMDESNDLKSRFCFVGVALSERGRPWIDLTKDKIFASSLFPASCPAKIEALAWQDGNGWLASGARIRFHLYDEGPSVIAFCLF